MESDAFSILKEMLVHCYSATVSVRPDGLLLGKYISLEELSLLFFPPPPKVKRKNWYGNGLSVVGIDTLN